MTSTLRRAVLTLACIALGAAPLAGCGGGDEPPTAAQVLRQTLGTSASAIEDGRMSLRFELDPEGLLAIGGPIRLALDGPFAAPRAGELPRFGVDFVATLGGQDYGGSLLSSGRRAFVVLDDGAYAVDRAFVDRVRSGIDPGAGKRPGLQALGIDPLRWISAARIKGHARVAGTDTIRIGGRVNSERLLADVDRLLTKAGGSAAGTSLLPARLRREIAGAVSSATVDLWTGASDRLLRQLAVRIVFFFELGQSPVQGLNGGTIDLRLRLDDVNEQRAPDSAFAPAAGARPRPLAQLTGGGAGNILLGIGAGLGGGRGRELFRCITGSNGSSSALIRCISRLAP